MERLRPQLMDLLVCLARRPGSIVLKDEILAEVWAAQFVAESGLSRCVAELRHHLGDDAHIPVYIETIPKRGYRLVAAVGPAPGPSPDGESADGRVAAPAQPDAAPEAERSVSAAAVAPAASRSGGWRRHRRMAYLGAVIAGTGLTAAALLGADPWGSRPALGEHDTVLLADVENSTGDRDIDAALRLALAVNLGQAPFLHLVPREAVRGALVRAGRSADERVTGAVALDVCRREGAAVLLVGSIAPVGTRFAVGLEAIACDTGDEVSRALERADTREAVLDALERAATRIRRALGESRASLRRYNVALERATTPSIDALKALSLGDDRRDHGNLDEALSCYEQATRLDPSFALAWSRLGVAHYNAARPDLAAPAFRRAYALVDRVSPPERFYITAHYQRNVEGDLEKMIETYRTWRQLYPGSVVPPTNTASVLATAFGRYDAALPDALEAARLAPASTVAGTILSLTYRGLGRADDALRAIETLRARGIDDRLINVMALELALYRGDASAIERESRLAARHPLAAQAALRLRAEDAMGHGRLREARRLWEEAAAHAAGRQSGLRVADVRLAEARAEAVLGDRLRARTALEAALVADSSPVTRARAAWVYAVLGDAARAMNEADAASRSPSSEPATLRVWLALDLAVIALRDGRARDASTALQPLLAMERASEYRLVPVFVRALAAERAGQHADAAAAFDLLGRLRLIDPTAPWVAWAPLGRARALRDAGDEAGSAAAYAAFLAAWKDADRDAPLLNAAARERARLTVR